MICHSLRSWPGSPLRSRTVVLLCCCTHVHLYSCTAVYIHHSCCFCPNHRCCVEIGQPAVPGWTRPPRNSSALGLGELSDAQRTGGGDGNVSVTPGHPMMRSVGGAGGTKSSYRVVFFYLRTPLAGRAQSSIHRLVRFYNPAPNRHQVLLIANLLNLTVSIVHMCH